MKKTVLIITAFITGLLISCTGARDNKNDVQPYSTTDTNQIEKKNDPWQDGTNKSETNDKGVD